ncbi:uncharacterized protein LOC116187689 [Punica granatum]|uniref:Uncharacterized protein n=2 Tax=Punica granatum TaxID=22663 RepID=A0A2I0IUH0_PUNGR|nr:uncharacterized protein LOC116187689 [Punica granatum]PKI47403.1 hypothetical protein CRG98_032238 [Punica granatum]
MGSMDQGDDLTFKVNFTGEGAARLRETVKEKLKEFMGDYTDDTLVEYVVVLLRNGRRKDEARNELDVFLGDDSDSFVSWLWDHLSTSLHLYVQPEETDEHDVTEPKLSSDDLAGRNDSGHLNSEIDTGKSGNLLRSRHNRDWRGLIRDTADPPPLLSSEIEKVHSEEKSHQRASRAKRPVSPRHQSKRKRSRSDERHQVKREAAHQVIDAPRRLLQFAVRDAVATSRPDSTTESSLKRLRSVVSTSNEDSSLVDRPPRVRSVALVPNSMATVIKAVAEAAEDVRKVKSSKSVFDRLSRGGDVAEPEFIERREDAIEDEEYGDAEQFIDETQSTYLGGRRQFDGDMTMKESDSMLASDYVSDYERYEETDVRAHDNVSHGDALGGDDEILLKMHHNAAHNGSDGMRFRWNEEDEPPVTKNTSRKMVNIPGSVSTRKPRPPYQAPSEIPAHQVQKPLQQNFTAANKSDVQVMRDNGGPVRVSNGDVKSVFDSQRANQPTSGVSARSMEDADSRTIFVNNVHIAATKDSLSQHVSKFGEVLKVIINTDAATGQPIGSAIIEFGRKESADSALSLDGTSFMSRILKVMKRSSPALQKPAPATAMTWPRAVWGSPYARFPRAPFPRGMPSAFRARPLMRGGARSLQWKRDAQPNSAEASTSASASSSTFNATHSFTARRFTYVRTEAKPEGNVGASAT